ncbi:MAG: hypothetical protein SGJ13_10050 [Actinomycetota bacterium]|nr:hypothetical protein [Actinomycetota bacterium]
MNHADRIRAAKDALLNGEWKSDPELLAQVDWLLSKPPIERLQILEADNAFLSALRPAPETC